MHALGPTLERRRPPRQRAHDAVADGQVVLDDVELGDGGRALGFREDHPIGARPAQVAPAGIDRRLGSGHPGSSTASLACVLPAWPSWQDFVDGALTEGEMTFLFGDR